ncbi:hypothetical protein AYI69_g6640, partial [Smittium culicis]|jgi:hypothetical protein
MGNS